MYLDVLHRKINKSCTCQLSQKVVMLHRFCVGNVQSSEVLNEICSELTNECLEAVRQNASRRELFSQCVE